MHSWLSPLSNSMKFGVKPTQLALSAVIIFIPILILQSFYLKFRTEQKIKKWEKSSQLRKEESKESYQSLLDRQNVVSDNQTQKEAETKKIRPLTSTYNLHILLIKPSLSILSTTQCIATLFLKIFKHQCNF